MEILPIKSSAEAVKEALNMIQFERNGVQVGLYSRFSSFNRAMIKYFRFGTVNLIAGLSGHGKSFLLNMLEDDFSSIDIPNMKLGVDNTNFFDRKKKVAVLAFKYEMSAKDEMIRTLSGRISKSSAYILSSEYNNGKYNDLGDDEYLNIEVELNKLADRSIYYIETVGNLEQLFNTCLYFRKEYPDTMIVVTIDHSLLSKKLTEKDDLELIQQTGITCMKLKKILNAMVIPLNQLNGDIERPNRIENPQLHYPMKNDIHCGNQLYWACDTVTLIHRPELIGIPKYGVHKFDTKDLIHGRFVKSRNGNVGNMWWKADFGKGQLKEFKPNQEVPQIQFGMK